MRYKLLGRSGLRVSELCLGTMTFGEEWGWGATKEESKKIFDAYANADGNFIDTANRYTEGTSEKYVGEFIHSDRDHFVLATKYTLFTRKDDPNFSGNHRKNMMQAVDASLKRLNTDYIDLYWLHAWDYTTPVEEVLLGLNDLIRSGKVHYIGISDTPAWVVSRANTIAELRGWNRFVAMQLKYSLLDRTIEQDLLPASRFYDMAVTTWSALGGGVLTGKYNQGDTDGRVDGNKIPEKNLKLAQKVVDIAKEVGCSPSQVAINWVRQQPALIIPILGASKESQVKDNLGCLEHSLSDKHIAELNELSKFELSFPHNFYNNDNIRNIIYSGLKEQIDNHHDVL